MTNRKTLVRDGPFLKPRLPNTRKHHRTTRDNPTGVSRVQVWGLAVRVFDVALLTAERQSGYRLSMVTLIIARKLCSARRTWPAFSAMCQRRAWIGRTCRIYTCPRIHRSSGASPSILFDSDQRLLHLSGPHPPYSPDLFVVETIFRGRQWKPSLVCSTADMATIIYRQSVKKSFLSTIASSNWPVPVYISQQGSC